MQNIKSISFILLILISSFSLKAQQTPGKTQEKDIVIKNATAHIGNGQVIENAMIVIRDGKIIELSQGEFTTEVDKDATHIEAKGKHVYPGFILPNSTLGLVEVDAVKATDDENEMGDFLPHIRSIIAYDAESKIVESMRPNGVLIGQVTPRGGSITGTSSIVQFDAWNWEDAILKEDDAIHVNWPSRFQKKGSWYDPKIGYKKNKKYHEQVEKLTDFFKRSKAYTSGDVEEINLPYQAMKAVFEGDKKVFVAVDAAQDILDLIAFKNSLDLENIVIVGGRYAHQVAEEIKTNEIPVLVQRTHSTPESDDDDYDLPYKLPKLLMDEGILVGLETSGSMERMNSRNLPFYAATTVAHGASKEEALQMITLNTAKILGIDDQVGSLEVGKDATLFISEGDALEIAGNRILKAYIQGRTIGLDTHQTQLAKKYQEKYQD
ncbi:MAG: amidohydrolase family protein [Bacteroidota bacterium]